jgi:hypothetical protein
MSRAAGAVLAALSAGILTAGAAVREPAAQELANAPGAVLRGLDKVTGEITDLVLPEGGSARLGRLTVIAGECRYPIDDPASDAYAWVTILDDLASAPVFQGWMIAQAPALSALDHARYDVWLIRCNTSEG